MCFKSVGEAAKASSRTNKDKEEVPEYPTREIVPVQGCSGCRRYSRAGMQMYMLSHLASHVRVETGDDCDYTADRKNDVRKHTVKKHSSDKLLNDTEEVSNSVDQEDTPEADDICKICDMAFENSSVLFNHNQEIHPA